MSDETARVSPVDEELVAERVADLADRIARREEPGIGSADAGYPGESETLTRLLPAIRLLSELAEDDPPDPRLAGSGSRWTSWEISGWGGSSAGAGSGSSTRPGSSRWDGGWR